jgi:hypothetical protein
MVPLLRFADLLVRPNEVLCFSCNIPDSVDADKCTDLKVPWGEAEKMALHPAAQSHYGFHEHRQLSLGLRVS